MKENQKGRLWVDWLAYGAFMVIILLAYTSASRFITLVNRGGMLTFFVFLILFFNHVDWIQGLKNREKDLIICLITGILVIINMFLSKAGPGVIFDIANLLLLLYLADRIELDETGVWIITASFFLIFLFWIKADGSSYNANTITIIVFESAIISALGGASILSKWKKEWIACIYLVVAMVTVTWPIAKKFWGRTTLVAILIMLMFLFLIPKVVWSFRKLYYCLIGGIAVASLVIPAIFTYIYWSCIKQEVGFPDKLRIFGGREPVWLQYFEAWLKEPWTGIGNDFLGKIPNLRYNSIHNGLFHILVVYGVLVFLLTVFFLGKKLLKIKTETMSITKKIGFSIIIAMMCMAAMESYIVTSFSNVVFFFVLLIIFKEDRESDNTSQLL